MKTKPLNRRLFCAAGLAPVVAAGLAACGGGRFDTDAPAHWAGIAMRAAALAPPPGLPPFISARAYAIAFLAAHDALQAILPVYGSYLPRLSAPGANADAAVAAAVHDVLVHELPFATALLDAEYASAIAAIQGEGSQPKGIEIGQRCAAAMLAARADDGLAEVEGPYTPGTLPGQYRFIPPLNFAAAVNLGTKLKPFSISSGATFRAAAPYAVTDDAYTADYNEVKALGAALGSTRSADQSEIGKFWLENTNDSWMKVAVQLAASRDMPGWELMRALALIQMAQVDAYIACLESKYFYNFWRPMTAIGLGDADGNPDTGGDAAWMSFDFPAPPVPDYPSGHAASGGSGAAVLAAVFGGDSAGFTHQSVSLPGPTRSFTSFTQMADEIGVSRVYVGYHFRLAVTQGLAQGRAVAAQLLATQLPRRL
jgi:PAP2 superfamily